MTDPTTDELVTGLLLAADDNPVPYIVGRTNNDRAPTGALQLPNAQALFNAFDQALRDEYARVAAQLPAAPSLAINPLNPRPTEAFLRLINAIQQANNQERFR